MKRIMKKTQDEYFEQAKKANNPQPFFNEIELRSLMNKGGGYINQPKPNMFKKLTRNARYFAASTGGKITMTLLASAFTIAVITLFTMNDNAITGENITSNNQTTENTQQSGTTGKSIAYQNYDKGVENNGIIKEMNENEEKENAHVQGVTVYKLSGKDGYDTLEYEGKKHTFSRIAIFCRNPLNNNGEITINPFMQVLFSTKYRKTIDSTNELALEHNIQGINMIELTDSELVGLDIMKSGSGYTFQTTRQYDKVIPTALNKPFSEYNYDTSYVNPIQVRTIHEVDYYGRREELIKYDGWKLNEFSNVAPVTVTYSYYNDFTSIDYISSPILLDGDESFKNYYQTCNYRFNLDGSGKELDDEESLQRSIFGSKLIPIKILISDDARDEFKMRLKYITMWYVPNEEFLDAMPDRISVPLRKELEAIRKIEEEGVPVGEACKGLDKEESFYDLCRISSGVLTDAMLFPNPARSNTKASYFLSDNRRVTIKLHDLDGSYIKTLMKEEAQSFGQHEIAMPLNGIAAGFYLVSITTDKGENVVQRLIVQ